MNSSDKAEAGYVTIDLRGVRRGAARGGWTVPAASLYGVISASTRAFRLRRRVVTPDGVAVISVGNVELGGNGKTPLAIRLLQILRERGARPVYVSRGYRGTSEDPSTVTVCAAPGQVWLSSTAGAVSLVAPDSPNLARRLGDEGALVATRCRGVPLFFSGRKARALSVALQSASPTHVVVDDAFQTWGLARDVDIVLLDAERPFGNGRLIPAGTLREKPDSLRRADVVGFNGVGMHTDIEGLAERVRAHLRSAVPVFGMRRRIEWRDGRTGGEVPSGERVAVLSGIARPGGFEQDAVRAGFDVRVAIRFPDHHAFGDRDLAAVRDALRSHRLRCVVVTEKDWIKLRDFDLPWSVCVARLDVSIEGVDIDRLTEKPQAAPAARS